MTTDYDDIGVTGAAPCVGRRATTPEAIHALWRHCMTEHHAVTLSFGGRPILAQPLSVAGDTFTYWHADRDRPERHTTAMIREVVDLGRSVEEIEARQRGEPTPPRRPGRPRVYDEPRRDVRIWLPDALLNAVDGAAAATGLARTAWIEAAIRAHLPTDGTDDRTAGD